MSFANFRFPTDITFGQNSIQTLAQVVKSKKLSNPFIVIDSFLAKTSLCNIITKDLRKFSLFCDFSGNPKEEEVYKGVSLYHQKKCDGFILVGGGSAVDIGKAIALIASHGNKISDYEDGVKGSLEIENKIAFMIAVPTTAGTGSEVGGSSVISASKDNRKVIIWSPYLLPPKVIADSALTFSLPQNLTAATGIDALTHCIEAYLANSYHPMADGIALEGIRLIKDNLLTCYKEPNNNKARGSMLMASMMGAVAFQKGLGVTHSCAHALSSCHGLHHGLANAVLLKEAMQFNYPECEEKFSVLSKIVYKKNITKDFFEWIDQISDHLNIVTPQIKVCDELVAAAFADPCHQSNPRKCTKKDIENIFNATFTR